MDIVPSTVIANLEKLYAAEFVRRQEAIRRARAVLPPLVEALVTEFGAIRVVLIGSLARGLFDDGSDIDLAVEGIGGERQFDAYCRLWDLAGFPVDVLRIEDGSPFVLSALRSHGEVLHDSR